MNQKKFWERFHKILSSDQRLDDPDAMADLEDPGGKKRTLLALERTIHAKRRTFLANERTFLAWIRTSIAIMGFGFLIEKFSMFLWLEAKKVRICLLFFLGDFKSFRGSLHWSGCPGGVSWRLFGSFAQKET